MSEISEQAYGMYRQIWDLAAQERQDSSPEKLSYSLWLEYSEEKPAYTLFSGSVNQQIIASVSANAWPIAHTHPTGKDLPSLSDREIVYVQALRAHGTARVERPSYIISGPERSAMRPYFPTFDFGAVVPSQAGKTVADTVAIATSRFQESGRDIDQYVLVQIIGSYYTFVLLNEDNSFGYHLVEDDAVAMEMKRILWNRGNRIIAFDEVGRRWVQRR